MTETQNIPALMMDLGIRAKRAAQTLATASGERKHAALIGAADAVWRAAARS